MAMLLNKDLTEIEKQDLCIQVAEQTIAFYRKVRKA